VPDPCIRLLSDLVAIDSVNPSLVSGGAGEAKIGAFIADHLQRLGLAVHVQEAAPGRSNVIGVLEGQASGASLMYCGHIDTVGVEGMTSPFEPVIRSGRLYGRGAQDMKGGVAAMIDAARLARERGFARGRLIIAAVVDEEYESIGAETLVRDWRADAAVVTEPTDLRIGVGHKGFAWFEIHAAGRAAHGSRPLDGRDAIFRMGRVLSRLERLDRDLQARRVHPIMGTASLHASTISGGREWSSYPDSCALRVERRTISGETVASAEREISGILDELHAADPEFEATARAIFSRPPYETPASHPIIDTVQDCVRARGPGAEPVGMTFWTDAAILGEAGVPSVLFGPGGAGLHSSEEYVNTEEVIACRDVLAEVALKWCRR
jgi:acetylornithine deacetylase